MQYGTKGHLQTYAARSTRWSISWRSSPKSIGFSPAAPEFGRFPLRRVIAVGVIMITGTFGRAAFTFGSISSPLMPGMLMSDRIRMSMGSAIVFARSNASGVFPNI